MLKTGVKLDTLSDRLVSESLWDVIVKFLRGPAGLTVHTETRQCGAVALELSVRANVALGEEKSLCLRGWEVEREELGPIAAGLGPRPRSLDSQRW